MCGVCGVCGVCVCVCVCVVSVNNLPNMFPSCVVQSAGPGMSFYHNLQNVSIALTLIARLWSGKG